MLIGGGGGGAVGSSAGSGLLFDVRPGALREASGQVSADATNAATAAGEADAAATSAAGACGGPLLAAALGRLTSALLTDGAGLRAALEAAGTRLAANVDTYDAIDTRAATALSACFQGLAAGPSLGEGAA